MKKIFSLFCATMFMLSASAVDFKLMRDPLQHNGKVVRELTVPASLMQKKAAESSVNYAIAVSNIAATSATVTVTPASATDTYYWDLLEVNTYDSLANGLYADTYGYADVFSYCKDYLDYVIEFYAAYGYSLTYADLIYSGVDAYDFTGLDSDAEYVVFAFHMGTDGVGVAPIDTVHFTTTEVVASSNVITLSAKDGVVSIATTNNDPYFFWMESLAEYQKYQSDFSEASLLDEIETWINSLEHYDINPLYAVLSGNDTYSLEEFFATWFDDVPETGDYVAMAAPYDGVINGTPAYVQFHYEADGQAIEQVNGAAVKAVKTIREGQVVIERNGVEYNVLGTQVK